MFESISQSLDYLKRFSTPIGFASASDYLDTLANATHFLLLYAQCFPREWALSQTPLVVDAKSLSPRILEFLELVEREYFPIGIDTIDEWETIPQFIPFYTESFDYWLDYPSDYRPGLWFLLCLYEREYLTESWDVLFDISPVDVADTVDWRRLKQLCQRRRSPLRFLFDAIALIDHSTNNPWLDISQEEWPYFIWEKETLEILKADRDEALAYWRRIDRLCDWLEAQALFINQRVATEAIEVLSQLVLSRNLKRFATYFNLQSGSTQSEYTDLKTLERFS